MKKPALEPRSPSFPLQVKTWLETICGRRGAKLGELYLNLRSSAGATPTKAEFDALAADMVETRERLNALISRLEE